ncbi:uncharacterized protein [Epargyreus clarus]|uniref:uncharacterized protein n=1 Tax=Epargyreus clarus TaxID=520877 RepID=UPI003C2EC3C7
MEDVGHSPLLKFFVTDTCGNPNIESNVPGEQELRDVKTNDTPPEDTMNNAANLTDGNHSVAESTEEKDGAENKEDYVLSPVMTVTKQEAVFTKGDLKLQKISVTEDISVRFQHLFKKQTMPGKTVVTEIQNGENEVHNEVVKVQHIRTDRLAEKDKIENKKPRTRIPMLRFRQAVEKVKKERKSLNEKKAAETSQPSPRRSSIPRLKDSRIPPPIVPPSPKSESEPSPRLDDEFERLYDDLVDEQDSDDTLSIASRIEDPVKLENTFEELIHAYEEKAQSVTVEKVKGSKIPLLKRKSEQEIDVKAAVQNKSLSTNTATELVEKQSKIQSVTLNKSPVRTLTKRVSEAKMHESKAESFQSFKTVNIASKEESFNVSQNIKTIEDAKNSITKDIKENVSELKSTEVVSANEGTITKIRESVKIATPTFDNLLTNEAILSEFNKGSDKTMTHETKVVNTSQESHVYVQEVKHNTSTSVISNVKDINSGSIEHVTSATTNFNIDETNQKELSITKFVTSKSLEAKDSTTAKAHYEHGTVKYTTSHSVETVGSKTESNKDKTQTIENVTTNIEGKDVINKNNDKEEVITINRDINITEEQDTTKTVGTKDVNDKEQITTTKTIETQDSKLKERTNDKEQITNVEHVTTNTIETKDSKNNEIFKEQSTEKVTTTKSIDKSNDKLNEKDTLDKDIFENNEEDIIILKGKVSRIIRRIDSIDTDTKPAAKNLGDDVPKPKTVMSKIAMFERPEPAEPPRARVRCISQIPRPKNDNEDIENTPSDKPKIVEEVLKALPARVVQENDNNIEKHVNTNTDDFNDNSNETEVRAKDDENGLDIQIIDIQPKVPVEISNNEIQYDNDIGNNDSDIKKSRSLAELDFGDAMKGKVRNMIVRMNSLERINLGRKEIIDIKERPRTRSVSEKIALFERKLTPFRLEKYEPQKNKTEATDQGLSEEECSQKVQELVLAKTKYGTLDQALMKYVEFRDGSKMPVIGIGTALLHPKLARYIVQAAIDLGYRTIDTAFIYGNEKEVGEAIKEKIKDGTVTREELFIISKLWSTFHRRDLVEKACRASLEAMGLDYFDLYLIHNPMSFKEGRGPIPKIASVIQFSEHDYLDAWFGMEDLVRKGLIRKGGVSNFNSQQVDRVVEKAKIKPVVNQVECHPYLSQHRLDDFCQARGVKLSCYGVLGSKGTPEEYKSSLPPPIDDPLVRVMAAGLDVTPATLLIGYQLNLGRSVIVKASSAAHLWDNLNALTLSLSPADISGLHALNRNKRIFTFKGMGDTHRNYPFNIPF